ncbi:hypothetical protein CRM22_009433 [Opisthorchis felineus]|uniref:Uncharacterized protein n=1 Tax=Opisthorchis felineus TaxID=147828 RepID=A0A4S2L7N4_OPIFE|nr:hypothetical protein CRM22_009433 [Opisthorchis felineus]
MMSPIGRNLSWKICTGPRGVIDSPLRILLNQYWDIGPSSFLPSPKSCDVFLIVITAKRTEHSNESFSRTVLSTFKDNPGHSPDIHATAEGDIGFTPTKLIFGSTLNLHG